MLLAEAYSLILGGIYAMRIALLDLLRIAALGAPIALAACTDLQSSNLKTSGMSAHMTVVSDGSGQTTATAWLHVDNNITDFVTLSSGDSLTTTAASVTQSMSEDNILNDVSYTTTFSNESASGTVYTVDLHRTNDTSAPDSTCTLPAPFTVSAPAAGMTLSRASDIAVTYGPASTNDSVTYSLSGSCIDGPSDVSLGGDPGTFTISHASITLPADASPTQPCMATLSITRSRTGTIDPAFGNGGDITCTQSRTVTFTLTP
jgi:hypothetical protein